MLLGAITNRSIVWGFPQSQTLLRNDFSLFTFAINMNILQPHLDGSPAVPSIFFQNIGNVDLILVTISKLRFKRMHVEADAIKNR